MATTTKPANASLGAVYLLLFGVIGLVMGLYVTYNGIDALSRGRWFSDPNGGGSALLFGLMFAGFGVRMIWLGYKAGIRNGTFK